MYRTTVNCLAIGAISTAAWGATTVTLLDENFESGLGTWTTKVYLPVGAFSPVPLVFDATGLAPDGTPIYGPNTGFPASHAGGFRSTSASTPPQTAHPCGSRRSGLPLSPQALTTSLSTSTFTSTTVARKRSSGRWLTASTC